MVHTHKSGFSLAEIMIALFIIAILAGGLAVSVPGYLNRAKMSRVKSELKIIQSGITEFEVDTGVLPQRLKDLVKQPQDERMAGKWQKGGYMQGKKEVPQDPWGNKYQYKLTEGGEHKYELFSYGSEGKSAPKNEHISVWNI